MVLEKLSPNSPIRIIIFRKKKVFDFYLFRILMLTVLYFFVFVFVLFLRWYHHSPVNCFPLFKITLNYLLE